MFSHSVSGKDINNDFKNYVFLITFLNYIIQYFPSNFVLLKTISQIVLFNIFHRICVLTSSKNSALKTIYLHKLYMIFYKLLIYFIYIKLWCKSLWPTRCSVCISQYIVCDPVITQTLQNIFHSNRSRIALRKP
jgi:hypothetical protein